MKRYAAAKLLCALGADVNQSSVSGNTPLIVAAASEESDISILKLLLQQDNIRMNHCNNNGFTALMKAAAVGNIAAVELLHKSGADICLVNNDGFSAVFMAASKGHLEVMKLLMQHGVDVCAAAARGLTLLIQAASSNQPQVAEFLISMGVSVHAADDLGATALHFAADSSSTGTETMRLLLSHGADVTAHHDGITPLHVAVHSGQLDRVEMLLAAGADVVHSNNSGGTALHTAVQRGKAAVVKLLLEHGADVVLNTMQYRQWDGHDAISALMLCNDTAILKLLLAAGADVQAVTSSGDTCLHIAARHSYSAPVACLLIKAGADMHAVNSAGKTAAEVAHDADNTLLEQLLIRAEQQA
jgi:ankyrin repeat protein